VKNVQASPAILEEAKRLTGLGVKPFDGKALNQVERIRLLADYTGEEVDADRR